MSETKDPGEHRCQGGTEGSITPDSAIVFCIWTPAGAHNVHIQYLARQVFGGGWFELPGLGVVVGNSIYDYANWVENDDGSRRVCIKFRNLDETNDKYYRVIVTYKML